MSSLLWQNSKTWRYSFSTRPCIGDLRAQGIVQVELGSFAKIKEKLQSYCFNCSFSRNKILTEPAKWGAYFVFIDRECKIELDKPEEKFLSELLESVDPKVWVQNRDVVSLLLESLIKYSARL